MCGITGLVVAEAGRVHARAVVERMQMEVAHRGPDDCGTSVSTDHRCVLAHTRLSILDLSPAGHQPMGLGESGGRQELGVRGEGLGVNNEGRSVSGHPSPVGAASARYWIVFNGEIYNYRELREEVSREQG